MKRSGIAFCYRFFMPREVALRTLQHFRARGVRGGNKPSYGASSARSLRQNLRCCEEAMQPNIGRTTGPPSLIGGIVVQRRAPRPLT
jgi:hypothetical protein